MGSHPRLHFSIAPRDLDVRVFERASECDDWGCYYSVEDVYYAEVCILHHICRNGAALFDLDVGEFFECDFDGARLIEMRDVLL